MALSNPLRILTVDQDHTVRIALEGELDRATVPKLARELAECDRRRTALVVIDLSGLEFLDAAGFRVLLEFGRRLRDSGRRLRLVNASRQIRRILKVVASMHAADMLDDWLEGPAFEP
jgi:anti-anti-sigma factor